MFFALFHMAIGLCFMLLHLLIPLCFMLLHLLIPLLFIAVIVWMISWLIRHSR